MPRRNQSTESYKHNTSKRLNNPTQETERFLTEDDKRVIQYEPDLRDADVPQLAWQRSKPATPSKKAGPLYIHEKIDPSVFLEQLEGNRTQLGRQLNLFQNLPEDAHYECYQHSGGWSNRLIHGDSAQIMASLAAKENMQGKVQMIYFDPPYGISFDSNMQIRTDNKNTPAGTGAVSHEPEMLRVFRDTYKNGIHDYLDGIRENAILARDLLAESGSFFLQIGKTNVHRLAVVLDEVFGPENRIATITFRKTGSSPSSTLAEVTDYLLWYAKGRQNVKFHDLYRQLKSQKDIIESMSSFVMVEDKDGSVRNLTSEERKKTDLLDESLRLFRRMPLTSKGSSSSGRSNPFTWKGRKYTPRNNSHWIVSHEGLERLSQKKRLVTAGPGASELLWKRYRKEIPGTRLNNVWDSNLTATDIHYVVETAERVIERCILMSTDPGDLVLDITCGSGTTPYVAEKWGRRWMATDASRVPIALTRQRVLSSVHQWNVLKNSDEGRRLELGYGTLSTDSEELISGFSDSRDPASGFVYERIPYVSAATLAYDKPPEFTYLVDRPHRTHGKKRIASAFTVESHSPYRTVSPEEYLKEDMSFESQENIIEAIRSGGFRLTEGNRYLVQDIEKVSSDFLT